MRLFAPIALLITALAGFAPPLAAQSRLAFDAPPSAWWMQRIDSTLRVAGELRVSLAAAPRLRIGREALFDAQGIRPTSEASIVDWQHITTIESPEPGAWRGGLIGAMVGTTVAVALSFAIGFQRDELEPATSLESETLLLMAAGAAVGGFVGSERGAWRRLYPPDLSDGIPVRERRP